MTAEISALDATPGVFTPAARTDGDNSKPQDGRGLAAPGLIRPVLLFAIPPTEAEWVARCVPWPEQKRVRLVLHTLALIHAADDKVKACERWAAHFQAKEEFKGQRGFSPDRLRALYYSYRKSGNWRVCLNNSKVREGEGMPAKFLEFWRALCERNQRVCSDAFRELLTIWRTHQSSDGRRSFKEIPGYDQWPQAEPHTGVPAGWTQANLYRHTPDKYELAAARVGRKAASDLRLKVLTTRVGLRLGEFYEFDDHEFNAIVNFPGQWKAMRPRGFAVVDVLSGCVFSHAMKPTLWDEDLEKKRALTERDAMWFAVSAITGTGYRTDERGTTLIVEHGTMAIRGNKKLPIQSPIREDFEKRIFDATGGKVRVERSGRFHRPAHGGQFAAPAGGNFRFKPHVEGLFRLVDDRLASLPGQVGKDRDHSPEQLPAVQSYNRALLKDAVRMTVEQAARLKFPLLLWPQFTEQVARVYHDINHDTNHSLEGWEKLKFVTQEHRPGLTLPVARRLSRQEVFRMFHKELTPLPVFHLPTLLGPEHALRGGDPLTVRDGIFEFEDREMGSEPFRFIARGEHARLHEGEKFTCFVNPFNPSALVACDAKLRVVALCPPMPVPCMNDDKGIQSVLGLAAKWEADALAPQQARQEDAAKEMEFMRAHNDAVRASAGMVKPLKPAAEPEAEVPDVDVAEILRRRAARKNDVPDPAEVPWNG